MALVNSALLVKLKISQWYNRVVDRKLTDEITVKYGVVATEDKYVKALIANAALKDIHAAATALREFHNDQTLPWNDGSVRVLSAADYFLYTEGIVARRETFERAVRDFIQQYPQWIVHARESKQDMFDITQYPEAEELEKLFAVEVTMSPFPDSKDFRVDISEEALAEIKKNADEAIKKAMDNANGHLLNRLRERAERCVTALDGADKVFRDQTIFSMRETIDLVERLNITNDSVVGDAVAKLRGIFANVTPTGLRSSNSHRADVATKLKEYLK